MLYECVHVSYKHLGKINFLLNHYHISLNRYTCIYLLHVTCKKFLSQYDKKRYMFKHIQYLILCCKES